MCEIYSECLNIYSRVYTAADRHPIPVIEECIYEENVGVIITRNTVSSDCTDLSGLSQSFGEMILSFQSN